MASYRSFNIKKKVIDDETNRFAYTFPVREFNGYVHSSDGLTESVQRDKVYLRCPFGDIDGDVVSGLDSRTLTYNIQHYVKGRVEENLDQLGFDLKGKRATIIVNPLFQTDDNGKSSITFFASKWTKGFLYQDNGKKKSNTVETTLTKLLNWRDCEYKLELLVKLINVTFVENDTSFQVICYPFVNIKAITLIKKKSAVQGDSELDAKKKCESLTADIDSFLASKTRGVGFLVTRPPLMEVSGSPSISSCSTDGTPNPVPLTRKRKAEKDTIDVL